MRSDKGDPNVTIHDSLCKCPLCITRKEIPPCPHCKGTGRLTTPEPPTYKAVEPYVGGDTGRPFFRGGD